MRVQNESMHTVFYVAKKCKALESVVLGRTWMQITKCRVDWKDFTYTIQVNSHTLTGPSTTGIEEFLNEADIFATQAQASNTPATPLVWIPTIAESDHSSWLVKKALLQSQGYDRGELHYWAPKSSRRIEPVQTTSTRQKVNNANKHSLATTLDKRKAKPTPTTMWLPKTFLQAQGYYDGAPQIWIPTKRQSMTTSPGNGQRRKTKKTKKRSSTTKPNKKSATPTTTTMWIPKRVLQAQGYYKGSTHLWLPKIRSVSPLPSKMNSTQSPQLKSDHGTPHLPKGTTHQWRPINKEQKKMSPKVTNKAQQPLQIRDNKQLVDTSRPSVTDKVKWVPRLITTAKLCFFEEDKLQLSNHVEQSKPLEAATHKIMRSEASTSKSLFKVQILPFVYSKTQS